MNYIYRHFSILFIIVPIGTIYTLSMKNPYSYLNVFSIMLPIISCYRLPIVSLYIQITFGLPIILPIRGLDILVFLVCMPPDWLTINMLTELESHNGVSCTDSHCNSLIIILTIWRKTTLVRYLSGRNCTGLVIRTRRLTTRNSKSPWWKRLTTRISSQPLWKHWRPSV